MAYETILYEQDGAIAKLSFNRPDKLNSLTAAMHAEIRDCLDKVDAAGTRVLVLTGEGRAFCAGQDLADLDFSGEVDLSYTLESDFNPLVRRLAGASYPVICAVNGIAAGAGANVALACDIVLASESASFLQAFARIGLMPDAGGTWSMTKLAGPARARGMSLLADPVSAEQAESWGMIWKVVADDALQDEAAKLAAKLAKGPTKAYLSARDAITAAAVNTLDQQLDLESKLQGALAASDDFREGVDAFLQKRPAEFKGS
ncbi:MAG: enoyl-CoA hydratase-related protein [Pseudomonadota bacterium]